MKALFRPFLQQVNDDRWWLPVTGPPSIFTRHCCWGHLFLKENRSWDLKARTIGAGQRCRHGWPQVAWIENVVTLFQAFYRTWCFLLQHVDTFLGCSYGSEWVYVWIDLPSGNQRWRAGKWTIEIGDFPSYKPRFSSGIFQHAIFDETRGTTCRYIFGFSYWFPVDVSSFPAPPMGISGS